MRQELPEIGKGPRLGGGAIEEAPAKFPHVQLIDDKPVHGGTLIAGGLPCIIIGRQPLGSDGKAGSLIAGISPPGIVEELPVFEFIEVFIRTGIEFEVHPPVVAGGNVFPHHDGRSGRHRLARQGDAQENVGFIPDTQPERRGISPHRSLQRDAMAGVARHQHPGNNVPPLREDHGVPFVVVSDETNVIGFRNGRGGRVRENSSRPVERGNHLRRRQCARHFRAGGEEDGYDAVRIRMGKACDDSRDFAPRLLLVMLEPEQTGETQDRIVIVVRVRFGIQGIGHPPCIHPTTIEFILIDGITHAPRLITSILDFKGEGFDPRCIRCVVGHAGDRGVWRPSIEFPRKIVGCRGRFVASERDGNTVRTGLGREGER